MNCDRMVVHKDDYFILMKNSTSVFHDFPHVVLQGAGKNMITISKSSGGLLVLTMDIRTEKNALVARFDEQGFEVNPTFNKRHPDKSTIIVEDAYGKEIIKVRYVNRRALSVEAKMTIDGREVNVPGFGGMCMSHSFGADVTFGSRH